MTYTTYQDWFKKYKDGWTEPVSFRDRALSKSDEYRAGQNSCPRCFRVVTETHFTKTRGNAHRQGTQFAQDETGQYFHANKQDCVLYLQEAIETANKIIERNSKRIEQVSV